MSQGFEAFFDNINEVEIIFDSEIRQYAKNTEETDFYKKRFDEFIQSLRENFDKVGVFVSSFTSERDSLTHWLTYGGQYCIVCDESEMNSIKGSVTL
ncbi:hypothetical protein [Shewanella nanhaiensis]|uniref:Uncharacterized protein n=1 Tax=Shewanella nanhaiensis TaxID=2864872 RepID=A0ABS7E7I6_9GAMM|nr:hypothetical protein [Shewanella nanhaiensis]MBW8185515.1 hypothetical protein [Shewanella nanhaiensis]